MVFKSLHFDFFVKHFHNSDDPRAVKGKEIADAIDTHSQAFLELKNLSKGIPDDIDQKMIEKGTQHIEEEPENQKPSPEKQWSNMLERLQIVNKFRTTQVINNINNEDS